MDDAVEQVDIRSGRQRIEEALADDLAPAVQPEPGQVLPRAGRCLGQVGQRAAQLRITP